MTDLPGKPPVITDANELPGLDDTWDGCMITYTEQDFPTSKPYQRSVPGWRCKACGYRVGTSGLPPRECPGCRQEWSGKP